MLYKRSRSHPRGGAGQESGAAVVKKELSMGELVIMAMCIIVIAIVLLSPRLGG